MDPSFLEPPHEPSLPNKLTRRPNSWGSLFGVPFQPLKIYKQIFPRHGGFQEIRGPILGNKDHSIFGTQI